MTVSFTTYGAGGFDKTKPNNNVVSATQAPIPVTVQNQETLEQRARTALANNQAYLALAAPTQAQAVAQVAALTRQVDGLIRFLLGQFDSVADS